MRADGLLALAALLLATTAGAAVPDRTLAAHELGRRAALATDSAAMTGLYTEAVAAADPARRDELRTAFKQGFLAGLRPPGGARRRRSDTAVAAGAADPPSPESRRPAAISEPVPDNNDEEAMLLSAPCSVSAAFSPRRGDVDPDRYRLAFARPGKWRISIKPAFTGRYALGTDFSSARYVSGPAEIIVEYLAAADNGWRYRVSERYGGEESRIIEGVKPGSPGCTLRLENTVFNSRRSGDRREVQLVRDGPYLAELPYTISISD